MRNHDTTANRLVSRFVYNFVEYMCKKRMLQGHSRNGGNDSDGMIELFQNSIASRI